MMRVGAGFWSLGVVVALVAAGCSCSSDTVPDLDTGPDVGLPTDTGGRDVGPQGDTGPRPDTGPGVDMGPQPDTGMSGADMGMSVVDSGGSQCGNGVVDTGETCDTAIAAGMAGACPTTCNDSMACTTDMMTGSACTAACTHTPITTAGPMDGCCPPGATPGTDPDCMAGCGNGFVDSGETCDTAIPAGMTGACPTLASCNDGVACTTDALAGSMCTAMCTHTAITTPSGMMSDGCCPSGATHATDVDCPITCGNGVVDSGETCDTAIPAGMAGACPTVATCNDGMACTTDMLVGGGTCTAACSHTAITMPVNGDGCCPPGANHNNDNDCVAMCGNAVIEPPGETCDPPSPGTCDATCHVIVAACGDGMLQTGEDCDDGNTRNLDGCSSSCHYEAFGRLTALQIATGTAPAMCAHTRNQLGAHALTGTAVGQLNPTLNTDVSNGTLNVLLEAIGLTDETGVMTQSFQLGVMSGVPDPAAGAWPAAGNPIDWRFFVDHTGVDTMGLPTAQMAATITNPRALAAGPANVTIPVVLAGTTANLVLFNTHAIGTVGTTTSHPTYPASLRTPFPTFETIAGNGAGQGLCGDISVGSLAQIPMPQLLTMGATNCSEGYTYCGAGNPVGPTCNSLLDVLVSGCHVILGIAAINATQPDVPAPGNATVTNLTVSATGHHVTNVAAQTNEAYSAFFTFTANRAHASGEICTAAAQCQATQTMCSTTPTSGTDVICH